MFIDVDLLSHLFNAHSSDITIFIFATSNETRKLSHNKKYVTL